MRGGNGGSGSGGYTEGGRAGTEGGPSRVEKEEAVRWGRECGGGRGGDGGGDSVSWKGANSESYLGSSHWGVSDHTN